jgi:hypothetical protein
MAIEGWPCPCCGNLTFGEPPGSGSYDICPVCFWEDDPVQFKDPGYAGGANVVSLNEARQNFREYGASERRFIKNVRAPTPEEKA